MRHNTSDEETELVAIAEDAHWERHPDQTAGVARSIYFRLPAGAMLWERDRKFVSLDRTILRQALE